MVYYVYNMSRSSSTRASRHAAPTTRGALQFINGRRVIRGRALVISEETLQSNLEELKKKTAAGYLVVRTPNGQKLDLSTMQLGPAPKPEPLPVFVPDSINNDYPPTGRPMPIYPDGAVQSSVPVTIPEVVEPPVHTPIVEAEIPLVLPETESVVEPAVAVSTGEQAVEMEYRESSANNYQHKGGKNKRR